MVSKLYQDNSEWQPREGSKEEEKRRYISFGERGRGGNVKQTVSWILLVSNATVGEVDRGRGAESQ